MWNEIEKTKPIEVHDVLVSRDLEEDETTSYFVALYTGCNEEWDVHFVHGGKNQEHVMVITPFKKGDKWMYIHSIANNCKIEVK